MSGTIRYQTNRTGDQQHLLKSLDQLIQSKNCPPKSSPPILKRCVSQLASGPILVTQTVIHNFTKHVVVRKEYKVVENKNKVVIRSELKSEKTRQPTEPIKPPTFIPEPQQSQNKLVPQYSEYKESPNVVKEAEPNRYEPSRQIVKSVGGIVGGAVIQANSDIIKPNLIIGKNKEPQVYRLGDVYNGRRILMENLGIDVGTKTIVVAYRSGDQVDYISEINGYYPFERCTPFIKNMLNDPNKIRSDGTKRPARWFESDGKAIVLGRDAEEFAYAKNDTLLRPMAEGGIAADEEAMTVLAAIVQGLMAMAEQEIGKFEDQVKLCYCTTAPAINKESNIDYHKRVVNLVIEGYETEANLSYESIKESHAIVIDMSDDGTGIGISWGAGTVTVSYVKYGLEVYSFCWVGAGDWIDTQVAMRHGYDPNALNTMKKKAKETPTTVAKKKTEVDLTPGVDYSDDRLSMDIVLHYDVLINQVIEGIVAGFQQNESEARIEDAIPIYMAGGTSSPVGFVERVAAKFEELKPPFEVGNISRSENPLYSVASGCLKAAEMF